MLCSRRSGGDSILHLETSPGLDGVTEASRIWEQRMLQGQRAWESIRSSTRALLVGGGIAVLVAVCVQNASNFAFHTIAGHIVGPERYGRLGSLLTLTVALTVPLAALQLAVTRSVAEAGPGAGPRAVLRRVLALSVVAGVTVTLVAPMVERFLRLDSLAPALLLGPYVRGRDRGDRRPRHRHRPRTARPGRGVDRRGCAPRVAIGVVAISLAGLPGAMLATIAAELIGGVVALVAAHGAAEGVEPIRIGINQLFETVGVTGGIWVLGSVDILLATHFLPTVSGSLYVAAATVAHAALVLPVALLAISMPRFVQALALDDDGHTSRRVARTTGLLAVAMTVAGALVLIVAARFILVVGFGESFAGGATVLAVLALGTVPVTIAAVHTTCELARHSRLAFLPWIAGAIEIIAIGVWHDSPLQIAVASFAGLVFGAGVVLTLAARAASASRRPGPVAVPLAALTPQASPPAPDPAVQLGRDPTHPAAGGAEVYVTELARGWAAAGHAVTYFTAAVAGQAAEETVAGVNVVRRGGRLGVYRAARRFWREQPPAPSTWSSTP